MALSSVTKVLNNLNSSTLVDSMSRHVTDNIFQGYPVWNKLMENAKFYDGGTQITEPVEYDVHSGTWYRGVSEYETQDKEFLTTRS